ncbi:hypothetical protein D3C81_1325110 [compost metagenome]
MLNSPSPLILQIHNEHPLPEANLVGGQPNAGTQLVFGGKLGILAVLEKLQHASQRFPVLAPQRQLHRFSYMAEHGITFPHNIIHRNDIFRLEF